MSARNDRPRKKTSRWGNNNNNNNNNFHDNHSLNQYNNQHNQPHIIPDTTTATTTTCGVSDEDALQAILETANQRQQQHNPQQHNHQQQHRSKNSYNLKRPYDTKVRSQHSSPSTTRTRTTSSSSQNYYGPGPSRSKEKEEEGEFDYDRKRRRKHDHTTNKNPNHHEWGGGGDNGHDGDGDEGIQSKSDQKRNDYTTNTDTNTNTTTTKSMEKKADFGLSGALAKDDKTGNVYNGILLKFTEPPEARVPNTRWRLYVFKKGGGNNGKGGAKEEQEDLLQVLHVSKQSAYLFGRERKVADIPVDHPSLSKQHCVLQYRAVPVPVSQQQQQVRCKPYLMDLGSTNGTFINGIRLDDARYYELKKGDLITLGASTREYVILTENTTATATTSG